MKLEHEPRKRNIVAMLHGSLWGLTWLLVCLASAAASPLPSIQMHERGVDRDGDGYFDWLILDGEIRGLVPNRTFSMHPHLVLPEIGMNDCRLGCHGLSMVEYRERLQGRTVEDSTDWDVASDRSGTAHFAFAFDGDEVSEARTERGWTFATGIYGRDSSGVGGELIARTRAWSWRSFGRRAVVGDSVQWSIGADSVSVRLLIGILCRRPDELRLRVLAQVDPGFAAESLIVRRMSPGHHVIAVTLIPRDAGDRRLEKLEVGRLRLRVLGHGFGLGDRWWDGPYPDFVNGPGWEFGPWRHPEFRD
jgi:hypothetical protein